MSWDAGWWFDASLWENPGVSHSCTEEEALANILAEIKREEHKRKREVVRKIAPSLALVSALDDETDARMRTLAHALNTPESHFASMLVIYDRYDNDMEDSVIVQEQHHRGEYRVFPVAKPYAKMGVYHAAPDYAEYWASFNRKAPNGCGKKHPRGRLWKDGELVIAAA
jgi:hypothetical protein